MKREHALERENCKGSRNEVDPMAPANFELVATDPCVGLQNIEGGGLSMGLSKYTLQKLYLRSRGCRKQLAHGHTIGLLTKSNNNAHNEVNNVIENRDNLSPAMRGSGLKEVAE